MTEQEGRQYPPEYPIEIDKLRQLAEFLPEANPVSYEFSTLLADRLDQCRKITPLAFVLTASLLVKDLERGIDGFTGKPIMLIQSFRGLKKGNNIRVISLKSFLPFLLRL